MSSQPQREVKGYVKTEIKPEINGVDSSHLTKAAATKWSDLPDDKDLNIPKLLDLTEDNLTENVIRINSQGKENPRLNYVLSKLVKVLHDFVKDVELQTHEWELAWQFLTKTGQISDDTRHEFILLSDILGISALVDTITYPRVEGATESSVLGPFFDDAAHEVECGESICSENRGEVTLVRGKVLDAKTGKPISKALIEYDPSTWSGADGSVWETDGDGFYDIQYVDGEGPDCRGRLYTREDGSYDFVAIKPVSYPISNDGPVGSLLRALGRHWMRPAHMHFMIMHPEYNKLVTALYTRDDKYVTSDTVKSSLMVDYKWTEDVEMAKKYKIANPEKGFWLLEFDFKLMPKTPPKVLKVKDD